MDVNKRVSLNINIRGLEESATLAFNEKSKELSRKGVKVYNLSLGQSPFPVPDPVVEALRVHAHEKSYLPVRGLPALRTEVARFHRRKDNVEVRSTRVLIGPGSKELMFLLQLVFYGELVVPTPSWVSYVPQAQILGKKIRLISTSYEDRWHMTPERLAELCESEHDVYRPRILVLNYPGNPDGLSYTTDELKRIAKIARKYEFILLSDEIYGELDHKGQHVSVARFYPEGTIISSGLSKWCGAGGWRLGTFTFPRDLSWLLDAMAVAASQTYTSVSTPIQHAAVRAFRGGMRIERYLWHVRRTLSALGTRCAEMLSETGIRVHPPTGAFYLFVDFSPLAKNLAKRGIGDGPTLCEKLLKDTGVVILPGASFERPRKELTARLAYVNFDGAKALSASETVPLDRELPPDFLETWCSDTLEGVTRIAQWASRGE
ncbi:MAG: aminotransferase class I/II-fold pyridoxal phosphate-dependent enzyme [Thermoplasmata archaeon]|nr:aminotransferase class I/II-fold pyridoxal phosphate-dependent enzyme [Thermoplasmata archaeon]